MKKVGIYSGTFDPIHDGHVAFALAAIDAAGLDKVFFMVEGRPRRKQGVKALEHREEMVARAIKRQPRLGYIMMEQPRFTVTHTLPPLISRFKGAEMYFLMGDDMLRHLATWPHVSELFKAARFIVARRRFEDPSISDMIHNVEKTTGHMLHHRIVDTPAARFSSSRIRSAIKRGHEPAGVAPTVLEYIRAAGLYRSDTNG